MNKLSVSSHPTDEGTAVSADMLILSIMEEDAGSGFV